MIGQELLKRIEVFTENGILVGVFALEIREMGKEMRKINENRKERI